MYETEDFGCGFCAYFGFCFCWLWWGGGESGINLDGRWEHERGFDIIAFSGNTFTLALQHAGDEMLGAFAVSDDIIELVYDDDSIDVHTFSHTENTLALDETPVLSSRLVNAPTPATIE